MRAHVDHHRLSEGLRAAVDRQVREYDVVRPPDEHAIVGKGDEVTPPVDRQVGAGAYLRSKLDAHIPGEPDPERPPRALHGFAETSRSRVRWRADHHDLAVQPAR